MLPLLPSLKVLQDWVGCEAPELSHAAMSEVSPHHSWQSGSTQSQATNDGH